MQVLAAACRFNNVIQEALYGKAFTCLYCNNRAVVSGFARGGAAAPPAWTLLNFV